MTSLHIAQASVNRCNENEKHSSANFPHNLLKHWNIRIENTLHVLGEHTGIIESLVIESLDYHRVGRLYL